MPIILTAVSCIGIHMPSIVRTLPNSPRLFGRVPNVTGVPLRHVATSLGDVFGSPLSVGPVKASQRVVKNDLCRPDSWRLKAL